MSIPSRADIDAAIRERLNSDPAFREALLADPRSAVAEIVGVEVPEAVSITVHEESLTDVHLVIPALVGEVSEDDLELVSGGALDWAHACGP